MPPEFIVASPVKVLVPLYPKIIKLPPTVVVPVTAKVDPPIVKVVPFPIFKILAIVIFAAVETEAVPLVDRLLKALVLDPPIVFPEPVIINVLLPGVNVPLFVQSPATVCVDEPPSNVVPEPIFTVPPMASPAAAVLIALPDRLRL